MPPLAPLEGLQQQHPTNVAPHLQRPARPGGGDAVGGSPPRAAGARAQDDALYESDLYRIHCFKILPCGKRYAHDWMRCPFRHPGEKAARRPLTEGSWYSATMCPDQLRGATCPRGDACGFAHNVFEHWLHPDRYRTQLCRDGAACSRRVCFFAHSIQQLRTPSGRVIPAAETAEAVAAAGWAVHLGPGPGNGAGTTAGLLADAPLMEFCAPMPVVDGNAGPLNADMILYVPVASDTMRSTPGRLPSHAIATVLPHAVPGGANRFNMGNTILPPPGHSGLLQTTPGLLGSAGLLAPSVNDVYQILMQDASHKQSEAEAAADAATRAQAAADEAAALINQLVLTGPLDRRAMSANGTTLPCGDASPPPRVAPAFPPGAGRGSLETLRTPSTSGPLLRFLSSDQPMAGPGPSGAACLLSAPLPGTTAAMTAAPGAQQEMLVQLPPQGTGAQGSPVMWYGPL